MDLRLGLGHQLDLCLGTKWTRVWVPSRLAFGYQVNSCLGTKWTRVRVPNRLVFEYQVDLVLIGVPV